MTPDQHVILTSSIYAAESSHLFGHETEEPSGADRVDGGHQDVVEPGRRVVDVLWHLVSPGHPHAGGRVPEVIEQSGLRGRPLVW